ncbi:hypothetical protein SESBI_34798 [Sesbania bispinosa]|nr:hypothetical protein SESBI_34798 [Sesbania bispinosa]
MEKFFKNEEINIRRKYQEGNTKLQKVLEALEDHHKTIRSKKQILKLLLMQTKQRKILSK